jgi:hypothetical protein
MNNPDDQDKAPDWQLWRHMPEVKLWQAVVLSLNENPDRLTYSNGRIVSGETVDEYFSENRDATKRIRLLIANHFDRRHFSACTLNMGDPRLSGVRLPEFAAWALSVVEWEGLPPELVAMAQTPEVPAPADSTNVSSARLMLRMTKEKVAEHYAQRTLNAIVEQEAVSQNQAAGDLQKVGAGDSTKRNEWTDNALKQLWNESLAPEMTQKKLAEQYGVTHQSISKQIKRARDKFSTTKKAKKNWLS